jgi:hypothetical protein
MGDGMITFSVKNFERFQHYKDRSPPWIKLYNELLDDYEFGRLQDASKLHLILIWLLASRSENKLPYDPAWIAKRINASEDVNLEVLREAGFIVVDQTLHSPEQNASDMLAKCLPRERGRGRAEGEAEQTRDVVSLLQSACGQAGIDQRKAVNWLGIGQAWLRLDLTDEQILACIAEIAARPGYKPPGTLAYFTPMLTDAASQPKPEKPAELTPEQRAELPWRFVRAYKRDGQWRGEGPPPGSKGCTVDPAILREFGYEVVP